MAVTPRLPPVTGGAGSGSVPRGTVLLLDCRNPLRGGGGLENYIHAHALVAARAGFHVRMFCVAERASVQTTEFGSLHVIASPLRPHVYFAAVAHRPWYARGLAAALNAQPPTGPVIAHSFGGLMVPMAQVARRTLARHGIATALLASAVTTMRHEAAGMLRGERRDHGALNIARGITRYAWVRTIAAPAEGRGYRASPLVLVNYQAVAQLLAIAYGPGLPARRIPYASLMAFAADAGGSPPPRLRPAPAAIAALRPRDAPLIVSVSRHDPRKGIYILLAALRRLAAAGVPFRACLVGRGVQLEAHRRVAVRWGLSDHVAITGHVPEVTPYLHSADVFVLPSLEEGSGSLSLLEAMQAGRAIVASACDGIPEDVRDGEHALLVPPGDSRALAGTLARMLADGPLRARLGAAARARYAERFSADSFTRALAGVYDELIDGLAGRGWIGGRADHPAEPGRDGAELALAVSLTRAR